MGSVAVSFTGGNTSSVLLASLLFSCSMHGSGLCLDKNGLGAEPLQPVTAPCILLSLQQPLGNTLQAMEAFAYGADEYVGKDVCLGVLAAFLPG